MTCSNAWKVQLSLHIHKYIQIIGDCNSSVRITSEFLMPLVMWLLVIYIHEWRDLQFKVDSKRHIFDKLFLTIFFYNHSICQKYGEKKSPWKFFSHFHLLEIFPGISTRDLARNKLTCYLLDYDDFTLEKSYILWLYVISIFYAIVLQWNFIRSQVNWLPI